LQSGLVVTMTMMIMTMIMMRCDVMGFYLSLLFVGWASSSSFTLLAAFISLEKVGLMLILLIVGYSSLKLLSSSRFIIIISTNYSIYS
jgi:hypothetical protein